VSANHRLVIFLSVTSGGCLFTDPGPAIVGTEESGAESTAPAPDTTGADGPTMDAPTSTDAPDPTTGEAPPLECGWQQVLADPDPPARIDAALALASGRNELLLFGGRVGLLGPDLADTWAFDGEDWRPLQDDEEDEVPGPRRGHAMAYDAARDRVVLFGGEYGGLDVKFANDTFTHDGGGWSKRSSGPPLRAHAAMAYLGRDEVVVMFGGRTDKGPDAATWIWDGQDWTVRELDVRPPPRDGLGMAVGDDGDVLLHGGCADMLCGKALDDTWRFDGMAWHKLDMGGPGGVRWGGMARHAEAMRTLRFGEGEGWGWTGSKWMPVGAAPQALSHFSIADLPGLGLVLFGGLTAKAVESDQTWVLQCAS
jgi:hypothetical protein